ncbi:MAG: 2-phosphoglycolate phosphatase [Paraglaciecola psychrophila]|jgi:2-phosphoglycolate phosphatase
MKKPSALSAVLFDLDGTLVDTAPDFANAINSLLNDHQRQPLDYAAIRPVVSNGSGALVTLSFGITETHSSFEPLRRELLTRYNQCLAQHSSPFTGIAELLNWLDREQLPWGIVTNKPRRYTDPLLAALGLASRSRVTLCPEDVQHSKPDPESLLLACSQLDCSPAQCIYIGDHQRDIEAGKNADMRTVAANYGYIGDHQQTADWQADFNVESASELPALLQSLR